MFKRLFYSFKFNNFSENVTLKTKNNSYQELNCNGKQNFKKKEFGKCSSILTKK